MINRLVHTWKTTASIPTVFNQCRATWKAHHPRSEYFIADDAHILSWLAENAHRFPTGIRPDRPFIHTIDMFRYCHLLTYGGMFVDLDMYCLRPMSEFLDQCEDAVVLASAQMTDEMQIHTIPNAWMYSGTPRHPFWILLLAMAVSRQAADPRVDWAVGSVLLRDAYLRYSELSSGRRLMAEPHVAELAELNEVTIGESLPRVVLLDPQAIYPVSWGLPQHKPIMDVFRSCRADPGSATITDEMLEMVPRSDNTFAFTFWAHTW